MRHPPQLYRLRGVKFDPTFTQQVEEAKRAVAMEYKGMQRHHHWAFWAFLAGFIMGIAL